MEDLLDGLCEYLKKNLMVVYGNDCDLWKNIESISKEFANLKNIVCKFNLQNEEDVDFFEDEYLCYVITIEKKADSIKSYTNPVEKSSTGIFYQREGLNKNRIGAPECLRSRVVGIKIFKNTDLH